MRVRQLIVPTILLMFFIFCLCPPSGHIGDLWTFLHWSDYISQFGIGNIYHSYGDLPPVYYYILKLNRVIFGEQPFEIFSSQVKYFTIAIESIGILLVLYSLKSRENLLVNWSLLALNISYFYNSVIWGQIDGIPATLNFAAIFFAYRKNWPVALAFFVLSLNVKIQQIVFMPLVFLMFMNDYKTLGRKKILISIFTALIVQIVVLIPFLHVTKLKQINEVVFNSVGKYPFISLNAANIWQWIFPNLPLRDTSDTILFSGITLRDWGLLMMTAFMIFVYYPLVKVSFRKIFKRINTEMDFNKLMLLAALTQLIFFFFNTQMHERYSHNAWLFIAAWSFNNKKYFPLILFSVCYFMNLEIMLHKFHETDYAWAFRVNSFLFAVLIAYLIGQLYSKRKETEVKTAFA